MSERTTSYVVYDQRTGQVVHTHREQLAEPSEGEPRSAHEILRALRSLLPEGRDLRITATDQPIAPTPGHRMFVDVATSTLIRLEAGARSAKAKRPATKTTVTAKKVTAKKATAKKATAKKAAAKTTAKKRKAPRS